MHPLPSNSLVDLGRTLGQELVATFISTALWGMMCVQAVKYFATYKFDTWYLKSLIIVLLALETFHEVLCIQGMWINLIPAFGNIANLSAAHIPFGLEPFVTGVVAALTQGFFTWRIWRFSNKNKLVPIILFRLIIANLVIYMIIFKITLGPSSPNLPVPRNLVLGIGSVMATTDVLIAIIMCILLWSGRTGIIASDRITVRLISASMSTGASTAAFALFAVLTGAIWPHDTFYVLGEMPLCAIYSNAVLANLNSRRCIRNTNSMNISMDTKSSRSSFKISNWMRQHGGRGDISVKPAQDEEHYAQAISAQ